MEAKSIYLFSDGEGATIAEVGGKGLSLLEGSRTQLPIPPGVVLTVAFFDPWFVALKKLPAWKTFIHADEITLPKACAALKNQAATLSLTDSQKLALEQALHGFVADDLFAVRSSSPNEDLEGASFAGGYETVLGVTSKTIEDAIKQCFISCLDHRVIIYMRENGFDTSDPRIAVIIQKQIASDISGVGFSLNPMTNNYDEAVFNANWGLGETVVAGMTTPDTYIVDKLKENITAVSIGKKELSIWLTQKGGTEEKHNYKSEEQTLNDRQVVLLTKLIKRVEAHYKKPIDIEWAFAHDELFLLQARPITTYIPLSPEMITPPGQKKRLYLDVTVTAQGMNQPLSVMGTSMFRQLIKIVGKILTTRDITHDIDKTIGWISDGKIYLNLSNAIGLIGKKKALELITIFDALGAKAIAQLDYTAYASTASKLYLLPIGAVWRLPGVIAFIQRARNDPATTHRRVQESLKAFEDEAKQLAQKDLPLRLLIDELIHRMFLHVFIKTVPLTIASRIALGRIKHAVQNDPAIDKLERALPHNVTSEMGLALAEVAKALPSKLNTEEFFELYKAKKLPDDFMHSWQIFLDKYGHRGPSEIDVASPRYRDSPKLLLDLLLTIKNSSGESPQEKFAGHEKERQAIYQKYRKQLQAQSPRLARKIAKEYQFFETFGGYRETHKYYLIFIVALIRENILKKAKKLVVSGRLDTEEQVFDLTIDQLDQSDTDTSLDLRKRAEKNTVFIKKLARISRPPALIDSRGFIPRPPTPKATKGEIIGVPVSSGIVRGRVKVLHTPTEKPLKKGEILVARATDPGWTPLFVNAAGLILEIGGVLQHGALVAREYGIPCVTGLENATSLWEDGTMVEVDGTTGVIKVIKE